MCKGVISILFTVFTVAWPASTFAGPITYSFVPLHGVFDSSGASVIVAGTITTDGVIGDVQAYDITSWMFSVTVNSVLVATETSADPTASVGVLFGSPVATAATLALAFPAAQPPLQTTIGPKITFSAEPAGDLYLLTFHTAAANTGSPLFQTEWSHLALLLHEPPQAPDDSVGLISGSTMTQPTMPFVIATAVPEPSAVILALLGGLGLSAWRLRRE